MAVPPPHRPHVLIAEFVEGIGNGIPDTGDKLVAEKYPTSQTAPYGFASFQNTEFTLRK